MILVTGAGGTIGKEFVKQLLEDGKEVTGIDNCEWALVQLDDHPNLYKRLMDFKDITGKFDMVIHCAAYKHIDLCEVNQDSAMANNVLSMKEMLNNIDVRKFVFMSTDKAVEPSSFYGWTKHEGEEMTKEYGGVIIRSGNVMGSNGSVIPKWEKCIDEGLPLPITDPEMTRYMLPVEKLVEKSLRLLKRANSGQVIIPEMGEAIRIDDMVHNILIKRGKDETYPCKIIGMRPGEKLHEKLKWDYEKVVHKTKDGEVVEGESCEY